MKLLCLSILILFGLSAMAQNQSYTLLINDIAIKKAEYIDEDDDVVTEGELITKPKDIKINVNNKGYTYSYTFTCNDTVEIKIEGKVKASKKKISLLEKHMYKLPSLEEYETNYTLDSSVLKNPESGNIAELDVSNFVPSEGKLKGVLYSYYIEFRVN
jgi:hypothetical protein